MKNIVCPVFVSLLILLSTLFVNYQTVAKAEEDFCQKLTFGGNFRARYEFQNSFNQKYYGDNPSEGKANDGFLLGRVRAGFDWLPTRNIHLALWGQHADARDYALPDSAFYSKTFKTTNHPQEDHLELYETYVEAKDILQSGFGFKAGRQKISYPDNRVFGPGEWGNSGRWIWDAVKLSWVFKRGFVDVFYGETMLHEINRFSLNHRHGYESLGVYSRCDLLQKPLKLILEPMIFTKKDNHKNYAGEVDKKPGSLDSWYAGARLHASMKGVEAGGTFLQEKGDFANDAIDAYGYHLMVAYTAPTAWKTRLGIAYSYASGDGNPGDGTNESFHEAFGAKDMMYGRMNLFSWSNLQDYEASVTVHPRNWLTIKGEAHQFELADRHDGWSLNSKLYRDKTGNSGDSVGKEIDITATSKYFKHHTLTMGFGHFWPDEFTEKVASHKQATWFFLQWEYEFSVSIL
ncbi:MAG: alginate export family protein [Syntrophobacteraceae bacterium]